MGIRRHALICVLSDLRVARMWRLPCKHRHHASRPHHQHRPPRGRTTADKGRAKHLQPVHTPQHTQPGRLTFTRCTHAHPLGLLYPWVEWDISGVPPPPWLVTRRLRGRSSAPPSYSVEVSLSKTPNSNCSWRVGCHLAWLTPPSVWVCDWTVWIKASAKCKCQYLSHLLANWRVSVSRSQNSALPSYMNVHGGAHPLKMSPRAHVGASSSKPEPWDNLILA